MFSSPSSVRSGDSQRFLTPVPPAKVLGSNDVPSPSDFSPLGSDQDVTKRDYRNVVNPSLAATYGYSPHAIKLRPRNVAYNLKRPQWGDAGTKHKFAAEESEYPWCTVNYVIQHLPYECMPHRYAKQPHSDGDCDDDFTGYIPSQHTWSNDRRSGRPDVLFMLNKPQHWEQPSGVPKNLFALDGRVKRVIVSEHDSKMQPLKHLPDCPFPVSRLVEGWRLEAWIRLDKNIDSQFVSKRFVAHYDKNNKLLDNIKGGALERRRNLFRDKSWCPTWGSAKSAIRAMTLERLSSLGMSAKTLNSTRHIQKDLNTAENEYHTARAYVDYGKKRRAGNRSVSREESLEKRRKYERVIEAFEGRVETESEDEEEELPPLNKRRRPFRFESEVSSRTSSTDTGDDDDGDGNEDDESAWENATGSIMSRVNPQTSGLEGFSDAAVKQMYNQCFDPKASVDEYDRLLWPATQPVEHEHQVAYNPYTAQIPLHQQQAATRFQGIWGGQEHGTTHNSHYPGRAYTPVMRPMLPPLPSQRLAPVPEHMVLHSQRPQRRQDTGLAMNPTGHSNDGLQH
ncbi:MAG: hypothetical protein Q9227_002918 [Pyrenula ochraceoflavens]